MKWHNNFHLKIDIPGQYSVKNFNTWVFLFYVCWMVLNDEKVTSIIAKITDDIQCADKEGG